MAIIYYVNERAKRPNARYQNEAVAPGQWLRYGAAYDVPALLADRLIATGEWSGIDPARQKEDEG